MQDAQNQPLRGERLLAHICTTVRLRAVAVAHRPQRLKFLICTRVRRSVGTGVGGMDLMQVDVLLARLAPIAGRHGVFTQSGHRRCACAHSTEAHFRRRALRRRLEDETPSVVLAACCIVCRSFNVPSVTGGPTSSGWGSLVKPTPHPGLRMDGDSASTRRHGHPPGRCRCSGRLSLPHHTHRHDRVGRNHVIHGT